MGLSAFHVAKPRSRARISVALPAAGEAVFVFCARYRALFATGAVEEGSGTPVGL